MAKKTNKKSLNTFVIKDLDSDQKNEHYGIFEHLIVGISISDSEELSQLGFSKIHIQDAMIEFARYLLVHGATLAYGGDLRSDGYTLLFSELAFQYRSRQDQDKQHFINFSSFPIYLNISPKHKFEFIKNRVDFRPIKPPENLKISTKTFIPPIGNENKFIWAESLSKMRNEMNEATNARIFMGGKCRGYSGKYPGILEEAILALGKLPQKLKRFEIESVKQKLYEKFKIYGVTNRCDFKTSRRWHVGQRDLSSTRHQPADIF